MSADWVIEMGIWESIKLLQILIPCLLEDVDINAKVVPLLHKIDSHQLLWLLVSISSSQ